MFENLLCDFEQPWHRSQTRISWVKMAGYVGGKADDDAGRNAVTYAGVFEKECPEAVHISAHYTSIMDSSGWKDPTCDTGVKSSVDPSLEKVV